MSRNGTVGVTEHDDAVDIAPRNALKCFALLKIAVEGGDCSKGRHVGGSAVTATNCRHCTKSGTRAFEGLL